jgi:hypothetical protein
LFDSGKNEVSSVSRIELALESGGKLIDVSLSIALTPNPCERWIQTMGFFGNPVINNHIMANFFNDELIGAGDRFHRANS